MTGRPHEDIAAITKTIAGIQQREAQARAEREAKKEADREKNRKEWPGTAKEMDRYKSAAPRLIWAIENGKQIGKPDCYSLAPDDPRWMR